MKTHEHALISVGYAAGIALISEGISAKKKCLLTERNMLCFMAFLAIFVRIPIMRAIR